MISLSDAVVEASGLVICSLRSVGKSIAMARVSRQQVSNFADHT